MEVIERNKKPKQLHQRLSKYLLISFFTFLLSLNVMSYFLPDSSEVILNRIVFIGTSIFTLSLFGIVTLLSVQRNLFSKPVDKGEVLSYLLLMIFTLGGTALFIYFAINAHTLQGFKSS